MRELQRLLFVAAGGLFVLGLAIGFFAPAGGGCGTAFRGPESMLDEADCEPIRAPLKTTPFVLMGLGVISLVGASVTGPLWAEGPSEPKRAARP